MIARTNMPDMKIAVNSVKLGIFLIVFGDVHL